MDGLIYIVSTITWFLIVFYLDLDLRPVTVAILLVPPLIFAMNWYFAPPVGSERSVPLEANNADVISFAVLITAILTNMKDPTVDGKEFFKPIIAAFVLMMLSLVDIRIDSSKSHSFVGILGSAQTMALALITYSLSQSYASFV